MPKAGVKMAVFLRIMSLSYVKKNSAKLVIHNDYYGYNPNGTTLLSALKKTENEVDLYLCIFVFGELKRSSVLITELML